MFQKPQVGVRNASSVTSTGEGLALEVAGGNAKEKEECCRGVGCGERGFEKGAPQKDQDGGRFPLGVTGASATEVETVSECARTEGRPQIIFTGDIFEVWKLRRRRAAIVYVGHPPEPLVKTHAVNLAKCPPAAGV